MKYAEVALGVVEAVSPTQTQTCTIPCGDAVMDGWLYSNGVFTPPPPVPPTPTPPTPAQQAQAAALKALNGGLTVTSTGTPAVNGTYGADDGSVSNFAGVETYVLRNNAFPNGVPVLPWVLLNGTTVQIPNTTVFNNIADAIANFVTQVRLYYFTGGQQGALPGPNVTIP